MSDDECTVHVLSVRSDHTGGEWEVMQLATSVGETKDRMWQLLKANRQLEMRYEEMVLNTTIPRPSREEEIE